jgi:hypothetical protein
MWDWLNITMRDCREDGFNLSELAGGSSETWRDIMSAAIAKIFPRASATSIASIDNLVQVALFSGVGLLLSLSVVILDQYIPGEWF